MILCLINLAAFGLIPKKSKFKKNHEKKNADNPSEYNKFFDRTVQGAAERNTKMYGFQSYS